MANTPRYSLQDLSAQFGDRYAPAFLAAVSGVLRDEGRHSDDPHDPGGDTWFGISRREYPDIAWPPSVEAAVEIYYRDWWLKFRINELPDLVAAKVLDMAVNIGPEGAVQCLQRACRACHSDLSIEDDGDLGPLTIGAVRVLAGRNLDSLLSSLRSECAGHYRVLAAQRAEDDEFIKGWLNRAYE